METPSLTLPGDDLRPPSPEARAGAQRRRLLLAAALAVARRGYAQTTVGDVVSVAHVSRRTFYEHFSDKRACFLAAFEHLNRELIGEIAAALDASDPADWPARLRACVGAYLDALARAPDVARALMSEVAAAGPEALDLQARIHARMADHLRAAHAEVRARGGAAPDLPDAAFLAFVGAAHTLTLAALRRGGAAAVRELRPALELVALRLLN